MNHILLQKTYSGLVLFVFCLSIVALTAEILPEVKAKIIVIPTLILIIIICILNFTQKEFFKRK